MSTQGYQAYFKKRQALINKTKQKRKAKSLWLGLLACILAGGSGWYLYIGDENAEKLLSKIEVSFFAEAKSAESEKKEEKITTDKEPVVNAERTTTKKTWTDEEVALFSKLEERKNQLDAREAELAKLEEELQKQKTALENRLVQLEDIRGKISAKLDEKIKTDQQKVDSLVSVYANMKPAQAAKVIESINEDLAVEVMAKMKNKSAAEILNLMNADKAKRISEKFAGYREPANK